MPVTTPPRSDEWQKQEVKTFGSQPPPIVPKSTSEEEIEALTKALLDNIAQMQNVHSSMKALTPEVMRSAKSLPYHPGATAAYEE